jgi:anti-sigma regulatory factor (Ser/Thr protein kinase)
LPGWPLRQRIRLAAEATAPRRARDFLAAVCAGWDVRRYTDVGGLVLSELVSNAVRHAGTEVEVRLQLTGAGGRGRLRIEVHDCGTGSPEVVPPERRTVGGNGLDIVSRLSESWGVTPDGDGSPGKSVWCVLAPADAA